MRLIRKQFSLHHKQWLPCFICMLVDKLHGVREELAPRCVSYSEALGSLIWNKYGTRSVFEVLYGHLQLEVLCGLDHSRNSQRTQNVLTNTTRRQVNSVNIECRLWVGRLGFDSRQERGFFFSWSPRSGGAGIA
jgi:hypothetical protein